MRLAHQSPELLRRHGAYPPHQHNPPEGLTEFTSATPLFFTQPLPAACFRYWIMPVVKSLNRSMRGRLCPTTSLTWFGSRLSAASMTCQRRHGRIKLGSAQGLIRANFGARTFRAPGRMLVRSPSLYRGLTPEQSNLYRNTLGCSVWQSSFMIRWQSDYSSSSCCY